MTKVTVLIAEGSGNKTLVFIGEPAYQKWLREAPQLRQFVVLSVKREPIEPAAGD